MFPFGGILSATTGRVITLPAFRTVFDDSIWPDTVSAGIVFARNGELLTYEHGLYNQQGSAYWMDSVSRTATIGDDYEVYVDDQPGADPLDTSGPLNAWTPITSDLEYSYETTLKNADDTGQFICQIRRAAAPGDITGLMTVTLTVDLPF